MTTAPALALTDWVDELMRTSETLRCERRAGVSTIEGLAELLEHERFGRGDDFERAFVALREALNR